MIILIQAIVSFLAVAAFGITLGIPKKYIALAGIVGAIGWIEYLIFTSLGLSTTMASLISALAIAIISAIFSKLCKTLIGIFFIPGILPIVPGVGLYRTAYYFLIGDSVMSKQYFYESIFIAGGIALSIFIVESLKRMRKIAKKNKLK